MSKFSRLLSLLGAVAIFLTATQAHALPIVFTANGTISSGFDITGIFGTPGASLSGRSYSQTISFDPERNATNYTGSTFSTTYGGGATVYTETEVNGHIFSTTFSDAFWPSASISNFLTQFHAVYPGYLWSDNIYASACSSLTAAQFLCASQSVASTLHAFIPTSSLHQDLSYAVQAGDMSNVSFFTSGPRGFASFNGTVSSIDLHTIPEPVTLVLVGIGLLGLAGLGRRRSL
ncbi:MAG TPA: PEP-CTERM sorting domain-containing protein [Noviherbaspirillum sp.]|nr:PEP-CTERM sorting domain-containing protein [Noviherbaspirillum sp.]